MTVDATMLSQPSSTARLVIEQGSQAGTNFPLSSGRQVTIGREPSMDIILQDSECSRNHARISWQAGEFFIEDLASSNGTQLNNVKITAPQVLQSGDRISIGQTTLLFEVTEAPSAAPAKVAPEATLLNVEGRVPSRHVLTTASETNQHLGHENLGFLSESHGIMPSAPPLLQLPQTYQEWDEIAERLPELYRTLSLRKAFDVMPLLSADEANLADEFLLRASTLLSMFAHAYFRVEADPPAALPECIQQPWEEISRRLNRPAPHLSYIDLIVHNWKLVDPTLDDPMRVENLRLLVPTVDNKEERIFYLTQVEILAQCTPIVSAVVRAQEAVDRNDVAALKQELILIIDGLHHVTRESFMKIDPNPYSDTYVDPVVWAKTVAPFAVPIHEGSAGPSGTSAPIFHILDTFFARQDYATRFGDEMIHLREWYPKHWQEFIKSLGQVSVSGYVESQRSTALKGIFKEATQAYVGESGFLSRHRLKVYGYLDLGFKVGRSVTITGFSGLFKDRTWDKVDEELESARTERHTRFSQSSHHVDVKRINTIRVEQEAWVKQVVLDVAGTGIRYQPGDRCAILPENSDALVQKTLSALRARGNEPIQLNAAWQEAVTLREGYEDSKTLPLRTLLTFGRIRPVERAVAKALYRISHNETVRRIVEARAEDQWELWDLIRVVAEAGFNPKRFWKAHPGERENICLLVPPESFRMYSISSVMQNGQVDSASELHLTVGRLRYQTKEAEVTAASERLGTASNYLGDTSAVSAEDMGRVSLRMIRPPRFSLPQDESTPIVMFAGGTGLSPFRSFVLERAQQSSAGESWLFFATRTREDFYYQEELESIVASGRLQVRVAFSRDDIDAKFVADGDGGRFVFEPSERRYLGDEMLREDNARALWDLLRSKQDGGQGAYFYVCGRTGFASSVMDAIKTVIRRFSGDSKEEAEEKARRVLYRLVSEGRYMQEIFTTYAGSHIEKQKTYDASEVTLHNDEQHGYWMVIDGRVFDLTEFAHLHHGGLKIISGYAGMDATQAYQKVLHNVNPEVDAMLGMYEVGVVRRLDFAMEWGVAVGPGGLHFVSLLDAYLVWVRFLYHVVEMENALNNDFSIQQQAITRDDTSTSRSVLKTQLVVDVHNRFMLNYVAGAMGESLENLWAVTSGLCAQNEDVRWVRDTVAAIRKTEASQTVERLNDELATRLESIIERAVDTGGQAMKLMASYCDLLEVEDKRFLREMKHALRGGVQVFEELERNAIHQGGDQLLAAAKEIPNVLEGYYTRVLAGIQALGDTGHL